jgi:6,7-dimethyl-8-ribityllumazine synthase
MKKIALVLGAFHRSKVEDMLDEARKAAAEHGLDIAAEVWVQGSLEKPLALKRLLSRGDIDGAVALGIIERGETKHGLVMGQAVLSAILALQLETMKPVGVGILGPEILPSQIPSRLRPYARSAVVALAGMLPGDDPATPPAS